MSHQIISPRKSSSDLSLSYTYNISPLLLALFSFLPLLPSDIVAISLSVSYIIKQHPWGPQLCHSQPLFNPRACDGTWNMLLQCTSVESINLLDSLNKPIDFTCSLFSGWGPGPGYRLHWLSRWNSCYPCGLGCAIHPLGLICLMGRVTVLFPHDVANMKLINMGKEFRKLPSSLEIRLTINISYYNYFHSAL